MTIWKLCRNAWPLPKSVCQRRAVEFPAKQFARAFHKTALPNQIVGMDLSCHCTFSNEGKNARNKIGRLKWFLNEIRHAKIATPLNVVPTKSGGNKNDGSLEKRIFF